MGRFERRGGGSEPAGFRCVSVHLAETPNSRAPTINGDRGNFTSMHRMDRILLIMVSAPDAWTLL
jgi:hypothetical protein